MMIVMNDQIRRVVNIELAKRDISKTELADKLGIKKQYLSNMVAGKVATLPKSWERLFSELELEFLVIPRGKSIRVQEVLED